MEIIFNGKTTYIEDNLTFMTLFIRSCTSGNINDKIWQRNGIHLIVKGNSLVKDFINPYDQLVLTDKPFRPNSYDRPIYPNFQNNFNLIPPNNQVPNQGPHYQVNQDNQTNLPSNEFKYSDQGTAQQQFVYNQQQQLMYQQPMKQQQFNQFPQQCGNINQFQKKNDIQIQNQMQFIPMQPTTQDNYQDIFQTREEFFIDSIQIYEQGRQQYLLNKSYQPGNKQTQLVRDGFLFQLDNYGDEFTIQKLDQSFFLRLNQQYKLKQVYQYNMNADLQKFENNILIELNYTRVAWIQDEDILIVQFNIGKIFTIYLSME